MDQFFLDIIKNENSFTWLYQFVIMAVVSMIPFAPIPVLAAVVASQHTFFTGFAINLFGTTFGSILLFLLSKTILRNFAMKYVTNKKQVVKYTLFIEQHGFLAVLLGRIIPIVPSAGINLVAGLCNVSLATFILATLLGKLPTIIAFSLAGHEIAAGNWDTVFIIFIYILALLIIGNKLKQKWHN